MSERVLAGVVAERLVAALTARGVAFAVEGGRLRYWAPAGALSRRELEALREHKGEVLALLADAPDSRPASAPDVAAMSICDPLPAGEPRPGWPCLVCSLRCWSCTDSPVWSCGNCRAQPLDTCPAWPCLWCGCHRWLGMPGAWRCAGCAAGAGADWRPQRERHQHYSRRAGNG